MKEDKIQRNGRKNIVHKLIDGVRKLIQIRDNANRKMEGKYSPSYLAFMAAVVLSLLLLIILFLPNVLGVADDGSAYRVMSSAGLQYPEAQPSDLYQNYFIKTYEKMPVGMYASNVEWNSQTLLVRIAVFLDDLITRDQLFDIRFLAFLYSFLYIPAFYLIIQQACMRVKQFSEGIVICIAGTILFTDIAYITYFNSFYPEAVWMIGFFYCIGAALSFQQERSRKKDYMSLLLFVVAGIFLTLSRKQTAAFGIILGIYCLKLLFARKEWFWGIACVSATFLFSTVTIFGVVSMKSDYDDTAKFHAMTRGVLYQSENPPETLREFQIEPSYELLTDVSAYDEIPIALASQEDIKSEFLDRYSYVDLTFYYLRHPSDYFNMLDLSVKSCFGIRRDFCGNYEKSVGLPGGARSAFWTTWSRFKSNTAPKTAGFFFLLLGVILLLYHKGYSTKVYTNRRNTIFMDTFVMIFVLCLVQATISIIGSGDALMVQQCFLVSLGIDVMMYFVFSEIVHKMNIF